MQPQLNPWRMRFSAPRPDADHNVTIGELHGWRTSRQRRTDRRHLAAFE